ncbi:MAG: hypothetical protein FWE11_03310 [Defluviitaleaceae bacterium]|nr:hypothetical protein [Defluviitaleaceae bacterium]
MGELPEQLRHNIGHAYILEGEASKRLALGRAFAKNLNCLESSDDACGQCISCRVFESGNHPDVFFVKTTKATSIGVDDVRDQIVNEMATKPFKYKYKVFIVDKAETLTPAAQNALLKTIEEPAHYGVFLFLATHVHTLLPTILSRCVLVKLGDEQAIPELEHEALAEEIADNITSMDILGTMALYKRFEAYKESRESMTKLLDMLYLSYAKRIRQSADKNDYVNKHWFNSIAAINQTKEVLAQNGNFQLAVELMLLKLNGS